MADRVPNDPENGQRYANSDRQKSPWRRCCFIGVIVILISLFLLATFAFGLIIGPEPPHYSIDGGISVKGMNLTSPLSVIWPEFDISIKSDNRNHHKIGIYYEKDHSSLEVFYRDVRLSNDILPTFYQPPNNLTVFPMVLKSKGIVLAESDRRALVNAVAKRSVPLTLKQRALLKFKMGAFIWLLKIRAVLDWVVTVDQLTAQAKIVHYDVCDCRSYLRL
jgi:hypothetical protein